MDEPWDGRERRAEDVRFAKAMADVRELKGATSDLAEAVKIKTETLHTVLVRIAFMLIALTLFNVVLTITAVGMLGRRIDHGHDRIVCMQTITPEQKAALGQLACK